MDQALQNAANALCNKVKHYLITMMGCTLEEATDEEFYRAFALALREEIMINWTACMHTYRDRAARMLYFLCMEYMPGRFLGNNVTNIHATPLVKQVMKMMKRDYEIEVRYEPDPGLGNGGLGRLAACYLDSLATQGYPAIGYGLRYQYGIFHQELWEGNQVERPENWLLHENPWEYRRDTHAVSVFYGGTPIPVVNKKGVEVLDLDDCDEVRALAYDFPILGYKESTDFSANTLRLWSTKESPRNFQMQRYNAGLLDQAAENTALTDVLYPNDNNETGKRIRLKQEFLLVSASLQDILRHHLYVFPDMSSFADKVRIHINDTHPALVIAELQRLLIRVHDFGWEEAWDVVKAICNFTNHTILKESLEEWNENRVRTLLPRQYHVIERLNLELLSAVRQKFPGDEERVRRMSIIESGQIKMAHLAIHGSHHVNGVSPIHTEILKRVVFKDFYELYSEKFLNVTNGVTPRRWLLYCNPALAQFISKRIGPEWLTDFTRIQELAKHAGDEEAQRVFWEIKKKNKQKLLHFLQDNNPMRDVHGRVVGNYVLHDDAALFDVHVKRIHEYKRQLLNILHAIMLYHELKASPHARQIKRLICFAGKAAPGYTIAKNIVNLIACVARKINTDHDVSEALNVLFIENYNVSHAEVIIPAADLSVQISTAGTEASGTGNMKLAMNGALTIGTEDGANIDMHQQIGTRWWPFGFGASAQEIGRMKSERSYNAWEIYQHNPAIQRAVDSLRDGTFCENESEHEAHTSLYKELLQGQFGEIPDRFFVLYDLPAYYETQKKVETFYTQPLKWAECALHNIAGMGNFSSDESVHHYAKHVWDLQPCHVDKEELARVRVEYSEHDKCRIF